MNRFVLTSLAVSLALAPACKKDSGANDAIAKMTAFKDQLCACKDKPCMDEVTRGLATWSTEQKGLGKVSEEDRKALLAISEGLNKCMTDILKGAGAVDATGSGATAGAGSAEGAAPGANDDPAGETMAHRAGMCPSTVLGATTKVETQGKDVVVTVEAADKDAIAAIQKRADESLAEKKHPAAGAASGHDRKGSHGGAQGLCPIYVPDGAEAVARRGARGVVVTITPKDRPDELAKVIEGRVARAADWVKANVPEGDQQNQGGVGGGQGEDGSNHSGKGDGKGRERKGGTGGGAGTGGGGGKGTGGGTSAGSGGGSGKSG